MLITTQVPCLKPQYFYPLLVSLIHHMKVGDYIYPTQPKHSTSVVHQHIKHLIMDGADISSPGPPAMVIHSSRPTLGFPLGTALLIFVIFSLSGIFSGCYHWEKLRSFRRQRLRGEHENQEQTNNQHISISIPSSPSKITNKVPSLS
jgi:hypothetical protein